MLNSGGIAASSPPTSSAEISAGSSWSSAVLVKSGSCQATAATRTPRAQRSQPPQLAQ
jgi:hypothetical protein